MMTYELILIGDNIPHSTSDMHNCTTNEFISSCFFFFFKCFHMPYVVENFPMKERTEEELKELKRVLQQKKIETECLKVQFYCTFFETEYLKVQYICVYISNMFYFRVSVKI